MTLACLDGTILPLSEAVIPVTDPGLLRGDGVFEVIRIYQGRLFAMREHMTRMTRSAANLRLDLDAAQVEADVRQLLAAERPGDGMVRALVTRAGHRVVLLEPLPDLGSSIALRCVTYGPTRILDQIKSLSYAANMLASRLAQEQGADEALLVTPHGRVLEAPTASFFWVRDGRVFTPPLRDHLLDSITRRLVIEETDAREKNTTRDDALTADEAFLASTTREVLPVSSIDDHPLAGSGGVTAGAGERVRARIAALLADG